MQTIDFLSMQEEYSSRTRGAKDVIDASWPTVQPALQDLLANFEHPVFGLADFGAADGGTSLSLMLKILDEVRATHPELHIHLNYSDLPDNDFNAIGRLLHRANGEHKSVLERYDHLTVSSTPVSFYNRVLPPNTLSLGFSATAMHWLRSAPGPISDHIHIAASKDSDAEARYAAKAHDDLVSILQHRLEEMHPGAYMLIVNFGINEKGQFLGNTERVHMFDHFYKLLNAMLEEGQIRREELDSMQFPQYYRRPDDYHRAVADPQIGGRLKIQQIDALITPCPYRAAFRESGDKAHFVNTYPDTIQTWSYPVFFVGLDQSRSEEERHEITSDLYRRYSEDIAARPEDHGMDYVHHLVLIQRV